MISQEQSLDSIPLKHGFAETSQSALALRDDQHPDISIPPTPEWELMDLRSLALRDLPTTSAALSFSPIPVVPSATHALPHTCEALPELAIVLFFPSLWKRICCSARVC
jgi:hypothetical protein